MDERSVALDRDGIKSALLVQMGFIPPLKLQQRRLVRRGHGAEASNALTLEVLDETANGPPIAAAQPTPTAACHHDFHIMLPEAVETERIARTEP